MGDGRRGRLEPAHRIKPSVLVLVMKSVSQVRWNAKKKSS